MHPCFEWHRELWDTYLASHYLCPPAEGTVHLNVKLALLSGTSCAAVQILQDRGISGSSLGL